METLSRRESVDPDVILARITDRKSANALLVIDNPLPTFYTAEFQQHIRKDRVRLMIITFRHDCHFVADIVHNQSLLSLQQDYSIEPYTRLLLGPCYTILDNAFYRELHKAEKKGISVSAKTLLLSFGGVDGTNLTLRVVSALAKMKNAPQHIIVVVGAFYAFLDDLKAMISQNLQLSVDLRINTSEMPALMAQSDIAITSGGLTVWELACLGVPNIIISTSERERQHSLLLEKKGLCCYLGHQNKVSQKQIIRAVATLIGNEKRRRALAQASKQMVDGQGLNRVIEQMIEVLRGSRDLIDI